MTRFNEHRYTLFRVVIYNKDLPSPLFRNSWSLLGCHILLSFLLRHTRPSQKLTSRIHITARHRIKIKVHRF